MAFLNGIFTKPQVDPQVPVNGNGSAGPAGKQPAPANPGANPAAMTGPSDQTPAGGPMDNFVALFTPKTDPKAVQPLGLNDPFLSPMDPAAFGKQISTANFASKIDPAVMQKAMSGDATAFTDVLNAVARESFSAAAQLSHGLVENGVRTGAERLNSTLDSRFRNLQVRGQNTTNETLSHPAVAPLFNATKMQIANSNPNLSAEQVHQQAESYFSNMAEVLTKPKVDPTKAAAKPLGDFSHLLQN